MQHVAIMKKEWGLLEKIEHGQKTIESRWYKNKSRPWNKIAKNEIIYFKNSGGAVTLKAQVAQVMQYADLTPVKIWEILKKYGRDDGIEKNDLKKYYQLFEKKKYCLLIFLKNVKKITPFEINKTGFGAMSAWICVDDINKIKIKQNYNTTQYESIYKNETAFN